ncbi:uncharacterized protein LOC130789734 [Actinidia eriantha]|uniref:uncharacterized protein LOC130789734 n=1 Tax=Actinidia eriantha TaxID=165200 RepID=UPI00258CC92B|nr:uncharacterized protein LOC130789734 [Actinidia eriantha]
MSLQGCSDEVMCKAFHATLKGSARSWFQKLSPGTIDSFGDLSRLFIANFMSCRNRQKNASHLFTVHQKETESLKDFSKADKYIAAKELAEAKRRRRGKDDHKRNEPDTRRIDYKEETRNKRPDRDFKRPNGRRPHTPPRRPEFILPLLNAPDAQVLSKIKHEEFIKWPRKIKIDPQKRNRNKYCEFHRDHGHNTEDYFQLKKQIADLIKRGYLRKYVATRPPPSSSERRYGDNRPTAGDIQMIHGGFGLGGCSTSSRKKHARSAHRLVEEEIYNLSSSNVGNHTPITFSNDDLRGLHLPHDDALIVSAVIANFNVQRILIDSGSSADILFISAFERMKIGLDKLHPFHTPLIGFGGNALADFIVESTHEGTPQPETTSPEMEIPKEPSSEMDLARWVLFVDGSSNQHGCGAGLVIQTPSSEQMEYAIRIGFKATNNEAEYETLLAGFRVAVELGA